MEWNILTRFETKKKDLILVAEHPPTHILRQSVKLRYLIFNSVAQKITQTRKKAISNIKKTF